MTEPTVGGPSPWGPIQDIYPIDTRRTRGASADRGRGDAMTGQDWRPFADELGDLAVLAVFGAAVLVILLGL